MVLLGRRVHKITTSRHSDLVTAAAAYTWWKAVLVVFRRVYDHCPSLNSEVFLSILFIGLGFSSSTTLTVVRMPVFAFAVVPFNFRGCRARDWSFVFVFVLQSDVEYKIAIKKSHQKNYVVCTVV